MNLNEDQQQKVSAWIAAGAKLAEIQKRLETECGIRLTYLEARLLVDDLKLVPKGAEPMRVINEPAKTPAASPAPAAAASEVAAAAGGIGGGVSVSVDHVARPGALVSGNVTFSDSQTAAWYLDETGRLGLVPAQQGYKPVAADVQAFQRALQAEMQKLGY